MINFFKQQPEKLFQTYNGFEFDFYRDSIDKCGYIDENCDICGGECEIIDDGYDDVTNIKSICKECKHTKSRYVKYSRFESSSRGYESQSIVTNNIKQFSNKDGYLTIYNIRYKDELVIFSLILESDEILCFEKKFSELDEFYKSVFEVV